MFNKEDAEKIDKVLKEKFSIIFDFNFDGLILLYGGAVKEIIMGKQWKDLDFVLLTQSEGNVKEFLDKYKIRYEITKYSGAYVFSYNGVPADIYITNDLYSCGNLNTDKLFYDIKRKQLIPIGIKYALNENEIVEIYYDGYFKIKQRIKKAKTFINFMNKNNKKIKVRYKYNRFFKLIISFFKNPYKIFKVVGKENKYVK